MHSYAQNCCYEANWASHCNLALLGTAADECSRKCKEIRVPRNPR